VIRLVPRTTVARLLTGDEEGWRWWVSRCEGFHAVFPSGRAGVVEHVLVDEHGTVCHLSVCRGILRMRQELVARDDVSRIDPRRCTVYMEGGRRAKRPTHAPTWPRIRVALGRIHTA
jgi:hypothetical protein